MGIPRLEADLAYISKIPDNPKDGGFTTETFKAEFDKAVLEIQKYINGPLIKAIETIKSGMATTFLSVELRPTSWVENSQKVLADGVPADSLMNTVFVSPSPASMEEYQNCGIRCTVQEPNNLTFTCEATPGSAISVNVAVFEKVVD